jgi:hypothetical protein
VGRHDPDSQSIWTRALSLREIALVLALVGLTVFTLRSHGGYAADVGGAWPQGEIRYYNAAPEHEWALQQAVNAWNRSGARVQLQRSTRPEADLVVSSDARTCGHGRATVGYSVPATISIFSFRLGRGCDRYAAARALTHELGHVLGLDHTVAECAAMNPSGYYGGSPQCPPGHPSFWRCRLLEPHDVAAAVRIYGGEAAPVRLEPMCVR